MANRSFTFLLLLILSTIPQTACSQGLEFQKDSSGILLLEDGSPRYYYQVATKSSQGIFPRANYVHPLYGLSGEILTEDFPEDHLHHRGIFWTWHQLYANGKRAGDPWLSEGITWLVQDVQTQVKDGKAYLTAKILWLPSNEENPVLQEDLMIAYNRYSDEAYSLTFTVTLTALVDGVAIGGSEDAKGYGGFSARIKLPKDISFQSRNGPVKPENLPVEAGPWIELTGTFDPTTSIQDGVVIMGEPGNLPSYQGWILREKSSMQNMAFPGKDPLAIEKGKSLSFRNQILVHCQLSKEEIEEYYRIFVEENEFKF